MANSDVSIALSMHCQSTVSQFRLSRYEQTKHTKANKQIEISSTDDIDIGAPDSKKSCNSSFETLEASIPMIVEYEFRTDPDMHACLLVLCSADVCDVFTALTHACSITSHEEDI